MTAILAAPVARRTPSAPAIATHSVETVSTAPWQIRTAPAREPLFDDEQPARHLTLVGRDAPALPFAATPARVGMPSGRALSAVTDLPIAEAAESALPDVEKFGRQLFTGLLEVLAGRRPAVQLAPLTSPRIHAGITRDAITTDRLGCAGRRATLRSMRVSQPGDGVAELSAVVAVGNRCRAIAARVENSHGQWRCVRLQIG